MNTNVDSNNNQQSSFAPPPSELDKEPQEVHNISLLEEKLKIDRRKRKVGEVIVYKQVETKMVQVPIRREKLIVKRIGKQPEQLVEVTINNEEVNGFDLAELADKDTLHITKSNFIAVQTAQELLEAVAHLSSATNAKIRLEIVTNCSQQQIEHQSICDRFQ